MPAPYIDLPGIGIIPDPAWREPVNDLGRQLPDGPGFVAPLNPFHAAPNTDERPHDHA